MDMDMFALLLVLQLIAGGIFDVPTQGAKQIIPYSLP